MNVAEFMSGTALAAGFLCDFETPKNRWLAPFRSPLGEFPCLILSSFPSLPSVPILFFEQKVTKETKIKTTNDANYTNGMTSNSSQSPAGLKRELALRAIARVHVSPG